MGDLLKEEWIGRLMIFAWRHAFCSTDGMKLVCIDACIDLMSYSDGTLFPVSNLATAWTIGERRRFYFGRGRHIEFLTTKEKPRVMHFWTWTHHEMSCCRRRHPFSCEPPFNSFGSPLFLSIPLPWALFLKISPYHYTSDALRCSFTDAKTPWPLIAKGLS